MAPWRPCYFWIFYLFWVDVNISFWSYSQQSSHNRIAIVLPYIINNVTYTMSGMQSNMSNYVNIYYILKYIREWICQTRG